MHRFDSTGSDRSASCAPHLRIELSLDHLIQRTCTARNQACPEERVYQEDPWKARDWFTTPCAKSDRSCQGDQEVYFRLR
jgi:hypothetical protein